MSIQIGTTLRSGEKPLHVGYQHRDDNYLAKFTSPTKQGRSRCDSCKELRAHSYQRRNQVPIDSGGHFRVSITVPMV